MRTKTLALSFFAATAVLLAYKPTAAPIIPDFKDAPNSSSAREELSANAPLAEASGFNIPAVAEAVSAAKQPRSNYVEKYPGDRQVVSWLGDRCYDAGCMGWTSSAGTVWNGENCYTGGCYRWTSSTGLVWTGDRCADAGCMAWRSNTGLTLNGENCYTGGCYKWKTGAGGVWNGDRCFDAGCMGWRSGDGVILAGESCAASGCRKWTSNTAEDLFFPFFFGN